MGISAYKSNNPSGGRNYSPALLDAMEKGAQFNGLPAGKNRWDLVNAIETLGPRLGLSRPLVEHLRFLILKTYDVDWEQGERPIVFMAVSTMCRKLHLTDRQIRNREAQLARLGYISFNDSGNCKRFGRRVNGFIDYDHTYGVELTPLAAQAETLFEKAEAYEWEQDLREKNKRAVSSLRRQIRGIVEVNADNLDYGIWLKRLEEILKGYNRELPIDVLFEKRQLLIDLKDELVKELASPANDDTPSETKETNEDSEEISARAEIDFRHIQNYSPSETNKFSRRRRPPKRYVVMGSPLPQPDTSTIADVGLKGVNLDQLKMLVSPRMREWNKDNDDLKNGNETWDGFINGYDDLAKVAVYGGLMLGISMNAIEQAVRVMGVSGMVAAILCLDQQDINPATRKIVRPGGYLRSMIRIAQKGDLKLGASVFGALGRVDKTNKDRVDDEERIHNDIT